MANTNKGTNAQSNGQEVKTRVINGATYKHGGQVKFAEYFNTDNTPKQGTEVKRGGSVKMLTGYFITDGYVLRRQGTGTAHQGNNAHFITVDDWYFVVGSSTADKACPRATGNGSGMVDRTRGATAPTQL